MLVGGRSAASVGTSGSSGAGFARPSGPVVWVRIGGGASIGERVPATVGVRASLVVITVGTGVGVSCVWDTDPGAMAFDSVGAEASPARRSGVEVAVGNAITAGSAVLNTRTADCFNCAGAAGNEIISCRTVTSIVADTKTIANGMNFLSLIQSLGWREGLSRSGISTASVHPDPGQRGKIQVFGISEILWQQRQERKDTDIFVMFCSLGPTPAMADRIHHRDVSGRLREPMRVYKKIASTVSLNNILCKIGNQHLGDPQLL